MIILHDKKVDKNNILCFYQYSFMSLLLAGQHGDAQMYRKLLNLSSTLGKTFCNSNICCYKLNFGNEECSEFDATIVQNLVC